MTPLMSPSIPRAEVIESLVRDGFAEHPVAIVLGSGLSLGLPFAKLQERAYHTIPGFPTAGVAGHKGLLSVWSTPGGGTCLAMEGRPHLYEGWSMDEVAFPVHLLHALGIRNYVVTNAAGGLDPGYAVGDFVLLTDHLNLHPPSLTPGDAASQSGWRKSAGQSPYDCAVREAVAARWPASAGHAKAGVYAAVLGPNYETPAEVRLFRQLGADLIGMSTATEALIATHLGMRVLGMSLVSNSLAGPSTGPLTHLEVLEAGKLAAVRLGDILTSAWSMISIT